MPESCGACYTLNRGTYYHSMNVIAQQQFFVYRSGVRFGTVNSKEIMMLKKIVPILLAIYIFPFNSIYAGCGSCSISKTKIASVPINPELINELGADGEVSGFVLASCGMCNFGLDAKAGCSLTIKIGETTVSYTHLTLPTKA